MKRLLERIGKFFAPSPGPGETRELAWDASGYEVREHGRVLVRVPWVDVQEVFAFQVDRLTFDDLCLGFRVHAEGTFYLVSEDFAGFAPFLAYLEQRYTGLRTDWFSEVTVPAFDPNRTTLWAAPPSGTPKSSNPVLERTSQGEARRFR